MNTGVILNHYSICIVTDLTMFQSLSPTTDNLKNIFPFPKVASACQAISDTRMDDVFGTKIGVQILINVDQMNSGLIVSTIMDIAVLELTFVSILTMK